MAQWLLLLGIAMFLVLLMFIVLLMLSVSRPGPAVGRIP